MAQCDFEIRDGVLLRYTGSEREVVVPDGVEVIGEEAFQARLDMEKVVLPAGVREIRRAAFQACVALQTLALPEGLVSLGDDALSFCFLREVQLPESLSVLGARVFSGCILQSVRIPPRVRELPDGAFRGCGILKSITLPVGLKYIAQRAFCGCKALEELVLPAALESLDRDVFGACDRLRRVTLLDGEERGNPEIIRSLPLKPTTRLEAPGFSLLEIPPEARHSAALGLADWESRGNRLPPDLEADARRYLASEWASFLDEAAENLPLLALLARRKVLPREAADDLLGRWRGPDREEAVALLLEYQGQLSQPDPACLLEERMRELETGSWPEGRFDAAWSFRREESGGLTLTGYHGKDTELFLPAGRGDEPVVGLKENLFKGNKTITSVVIPEGVRELGNGVFGFCQALRSVDLPSTLREVPRLTFRNCEALESVRMAPGPETIQAGAFFHCAKLTALEIPEGVKLIGPNALNGCSALSRLSLPETLEEIRSKALWGCHGLTDLRIPAAVRSIGEGVFFDGVFPERLEVDPGNLWYRTEGPFLLSRDGTVLLKAFRLLRGEAAVPEGVEEIAPWAWQGQQVTSIVFPDSVKVIGEGAFCHCRQLEAVTIGKGVEEIRESAFASCLSLPTIRIPGHVRNIGPCAFDGCRALASLTLEEGIETIEGSAFRECRALTTVRIPDSVTKLESSAFAEARSLTSIALGSGIRELRYGILEETRSLRSLTIPATVERIGAEIFGSRHLSLEELRFLGIPESVEGRTFPQNDRPARICVPAQVPAGPFADWLAEMAAEGVTILYG